MEVSNIKAACTETLIVSLLKDRPMHGYEMGKEIERRSLGYFTFKHSTLYPILHKLEARGVVQGRWVNPEGGKGKPKKHYELTRAGAAYYDENAAFWREFVATMTQMIPEMAP